MQDLLVIPASGSTCIIQSDAVDIQEKGGETLCFAFATHKVVVQVVVEVLASYNQML